MKKEGSILWQYFIVLHSCLLCEGLVVWPDSDFVIPMTLTGCPGEDFKNHSIEYHFPSIEPEQTPEVSEGRHQHVSQTTTGFEVDYCVHRMKGVSDDNVSHWPKGQYCVMQSAGTSCPSTLLPGELTLGVESGEKSEIGPRLNSSAPGLIAGVPWTTFYYCCNWQGVRTNEIYLPTSVPFYLFPTRTNVCQMVHGMNTTLEYLEWNLVGSDGGVLLPLGDDNHAYHSFRKNNSVVRQIVCYYVKAENSDVSATAAVPLYVYVPVTIFTTGVVLTFCCVCCLKCCPYLNDDRISVFSGLNSRRSSEPTIVSTMSRKRSSVLYSEEKSNHQYRKRYFSQDGKVLCNENIQTDDETRCLLAFCLDSATKDRLSRMLIPRSSLHLIAKVGQGAYGLVWKAKYVPSNVFETRIVAVKFIRETFTNFEIEQIVEEATIMEQFSHPNVLSLLGIAVDADMSLPLLVMPFMDNGDLQSYLRRFRYDKELIDNPPSVRSLLLFALHIARGMEYLAQMKFVHRDLAARNCMVDSRLTVKIADFGMTRDVYTNTCYRQTKDIALPVKWMAIESCSDMIFTPQSDMWAYGVTLWEIFSLAQLPYAEINNSDLLHYLINGNRLSVPDGTPPVVAEIMKSCWDKDPRSRPDPREATVKIERLLAVTSDYLDLGENLQLHRDCNQAPNPQEMDIVQENEDLNIEISECPSTQLISSQEEPISSSSDTVLPQITDAESKGRRSVAVNKVVDDTMILKTECRLWHQQPCAPDTEYADGSPNHGPEFEKNSGNGSEQSASSKDSSQIMSRDSCFVDGNELYDTANEHYRMIGCSKYEDVI